MKPLYKLFSLSLYCKLDLTLFWYQIQWFVLNKRCSNFSLTKIFWTEINILSTKFAKCLNIVVSIIFPEDKNYIL